MSLRLASALLALLIPVAGMAQSAAPVLAIPEARQQPLLVNDLLAFGASGGDSSGSRVVPLWASSDGRLLALVALDSKAGAPGLPLAPAVGGVADWHLVDATRLFSGGLQWRLGRGFHADALFDQYGSGTSGLPLWAACGGTAGCQNRYGGSGIPGGIAGGEFGLGWTSAGGDLDFSYGLSWLRGDQGNALPASPPALIGVPGLLGLPLNPLGATPLAFGSASALNAQARWRFGAESALDLGASVGRVHYGSLWYGGPAGVDLNQSSLSLGLASGSVRGVIVGHVLSTDDPAAIGKRWTSLDLGISWRTPWKGEFSIGAQNLFSMPLDPASPRDPDPSQTRMPYVQYRQDL